MKTLFLSVSLFLSAALAQAAEQGFISLFDGKSLNGWKQVDKHGDGYGVKDGVIFCARLVSRGWDWVRAAALRSSIVTKPSPRRLARLPAISAADLISRAPRR